MQNNVVTEIEVELELEQELEQEKELEQDGEGTNVPIGSDRIGSLPIPIPDLPGMRPGTITNPAEVHARRQQRTKVSTNPPEAPVGPEHPVSQKFLEYIGRSPKYLKQSVEWDRVARQLEQQYSRADLIGSIEWMWGPHSDRWWATRLEERRSDPFAFFGDSIVSIMAQYQDLIFKQKRSAPKENSNASNNDSDDYETVSYF